MHLAYDELLNREVAVKLLRSQHAENAQFVERFRREAKNAAALSHRNIVSVFDAGESPDGASYMAMEYVGGGTLAERIEKEGPLDSLEASGIALQVACALEAAHEKGVIHRDIKPHNIFLVEEAATSAGSGGIAPGSVKVGDFGIARAAAETAMTETSLMLGTVRYLSPEQATGEEVGPQSDLYSLGVVLYEMITGEVPFNAENPIAIAMKHISEEPRAPRQVNPGVSEGIQAITLRLLSKSPADRYAGAEDLIDDLECVGRGLSPKALKTEDKTEAIERISRTEPMRRPAVNRGAAAPKRRSRTLRRLGVVAVLAFLVGGVALAGAGSDFNTLYASINGQDTEERVLGMQGVGEASPIEAPIAAVDVPDVVNKKEGEAERLIEDAGLEVDKQTRETSDRDEGTVLSQTPGAEERLRRGSQVEIVVAEAPATADVPDLTGFSVQQAEEVLSERGLSLGQSDQAYSDVVALGLISDQSSPAGSEVRRGSSVGVTVSSGPEPVAPEPVAPEPAPEPVEPEPDPEPESNSEEPSGDNSGDQQAPPEPSEPAPQEPSEDSVFEDDFEPPMPDMPMFDD